MGTDAKTVYVAIRAVGDDVNEPASEILGVYTTAERAWEVARAKGPRTAEVTAFELDSDELYGRTLEGGQS